MVSPEAPVYSKACGSCILRPNLKEKIEIDRDVNFKCPFGLNVFVMPIRAFGDIIIAYMVLGPLILNKRKKSSEYTRHAKKAGIDPGELIDALIEINVFSHSKIRSIISLLKGIFSNMTQTGYHKRRLSEIGPEVTELDPLFSSIYEEKILNALLSACSFALNIDSGSVMIMDKDTRRLHIKVATELDDKIVNDTDIKLGEGIAGVAAANAEPIILPQDRGKNGLSYKMKRKYIKSSMIIPFNKENSAEVYGVINLNVIRKNKQFSEKDISLTKELVKLAGIALTPLSV